mmetsp:Transcript_12949/g.39142  ORF Transcript_12949/g.39142 Transcript_12949/m.39142 type:complete len:251 (-) Transcript_12949:542-1294(-)
MTVLKLAQYLLHVFQDILFDTFKMGFQHECQQSVHHLLVERDHLHTVQKGFAADTLKFFLGTGLIGGGHASDAHQRMEQGADQLGTGERCGEIQQIGQELAIVEQLRKRLDGDRLQFLALIDVGEQLHGGLTGTRCEAVLGTGGHNRNQKLVRELGFGSQLCNDHVTGQHHPRMGDQLHSLQIEGEQSNQEIVGDLRELLQQLDHESTKEVDLGLGCGLLLNSKHGALGNEKWDREISSTSIDQQLTRHG